MVEGWVDWKTRVDNKKIREERLKRLQDEMEKNGVDALVLTWPENLRYACDLMVPYGVTWATRYAAVVFQKGSPVALPAGVDLGAFRRVMQWVEDIKPLPVEAKSWAGIIKSSLEERRVEKGKIGVDVLPFVLYQALRDALPDATFVDAEPILNSARIIKSEEEIKAIREAVEVAEYALEEAMRITKVGVTEYEIAAKSVEVMLRVGAEGIAFFPIVSSGPGTAVLRRFPTMKRVRSGELVLIDIGCLYNGYHGIVGRTICVGRPSEKQKEIYRTVYEAEMEAINTIAPGVKVSEVDRAAREVIRKAGFKEYEHKNVTGWGTGTKRLEPPVIGEPEITKVEGKEEMELQPGMVIVLEPGIFYHDDPEVGGVRLSDMVLVTEDGCEVLTKTEYDSKLLE